MPFIKLKSSSSKKSNDKGNIKKDDQKSDSKGQESMRNDITVKFGKPVIQVTFKRIKLFIIIFILMFIIQLILTSQLFVTAIKIRSHLGSFINMISSGDGEVLPSLLALPMLAFLCLNLGLMVFVYRIFAKEKRPGSNKVLFMLVLVALLLIVATLVIVFVTLGHIYGNSQHIENGIFKAMKKYAENSHYKKQIDQLQIEFQCCGSSKYDDWYNISWLDKSLSSNGTNKLQSGKTPFSCCAIKSKFPCIHFDIETVGTNYVYTPEFNLSISTTGCTSKVVEKKREVGVGIVGSLFLYMFLEALLLIPARFLQTGHSIDSKFEGNSKQYLVWLLGSYSGRNKSEGPPEPPPVPDELKD